MKIRHCNKAGHNNQKLYKKKNNNINNINIHIKKNNLTCICLNIKSYNIITSHHHQLFFGHPYMQFSAQLLVLFFRPRSIVIFDFFLKEYFLFFQLLICY
jgi:hypothetical protein